MINIAIDFRSGQPIYIQIVEQIRRMVANGELKPGDQLPTVRQLATELRVNFNTVARAYRLLDEAGLISTQQGRGTYIWEMPSEDSLIRLRSQELEALTNRYLHETQRLGFIPGQVLETVTQQLEQWQGGDPPLDEEL
jgi:GntR family transcriptional regulator